MKRGKNKSKKKQKGGDLGQLIGATAVGAFILWATSHFSSKTRKSTNMSSNELLKNFDKHIKRSPTKYSSNSSMQILKNSEIKNSPKFTKKKDAKEKG